MSEHSLRRLFVTFTLGLLVVNAFVVASYVKDLKANPAEFPTEPANPILVIVNATRGSFSEYTGEILKAEGFSEFQMQNISQINGGFLASFDTAILTTMSLTNPQATMIQNYVSNGGNLIAFKPDSKLASIFGLTPTGTVTDEGYLKVDSTTDIGKGIVTDTIQFHGIADNYNLDGAAVIATLYSDDVTATAYPAVATYTFGDGNTVFFAYDFPKSIALLRQGNPANVGLDLDGYGGWTQSDLYVNYLDVTKVPIPQADEQMRLLSNAIMRVNYYKTPLPRLWYFPESKKTMLIWTGDQDWGNTTQIYDEIGDVEARGGKMSLFLTAGDIEDTISDPWEELTDYQNWVGRGHEIGWHVMSSYTSNYDTMNSNYNNQFDTFYDNYGRYPTPTIRHHGVVWFGWVEAAKIELLHDIRMDFNGYHFGTFLNPGDGYRNGWMTGSGLPMRFVDQNGTIIDVYQVMTQWPDDIIDRQGNSVAETIAICDTLLNKSRDGFYSAFCANFHPITWSDLEYVYQEGTWWRARDRKTIGRALMDLANKYGIPIWSGEQLLNFTDARSVATFENIAYSAGQLNFDLNLPIAVKNLTVMIPYNHEGRLLDNIVLNSETRPFTTDTIKGITYAFLNLSSVGLSEITANYGEDMTPPIITIVSPANGAALSAGTTSVTITVTTNENADCRYSMTNPSFNYLTEGTDFTSGQGTQSHSFTLTDLEAGKAYTLYYKAKDTEGNINSLSTMHTFSVGLWLVGWPYRKSHVINGLSTGLTDYQVDITLHYGSGTDFQSDIYLNSRCRADFGDVRFTDFSGTTLLSYWFEEVVETTEATVWIKVPSIPANPGSTSIYIYYGNPTATNASNGKDTFIDFYGSGEHWEGWTGGEEVGYSPPPNPETSYYTLSDTVYFPVPRVVGTWEQYLHTFQPVHKTNITEVNLDGYKYWAYYCDVYGNRIGLARSNDLLDWDTYDGNPILQDPVNCIYRWPSTTYDGSTFHMFLDDYAPFDHLNFIKRYTSTDGKSFSELEIVYSNPGSNIEVVNPFLWFNPNNNKYYLYFGEKTYGVSNKIRCKIASTLGELASAPVTDVMNARDVEFSPSILYDSGTNLYWLITEENTGGYNWITRAYYSSSPIGGFVEASNSPILTENNACAMHFVADNKVYVYYCQFVGPTVPVDWDIRLRVQPMEAPPIEPPPTDDPDERSYRVIDTSGAATTLEGQLSTHTTDFVCEYKTKNLWTAGKQLVQYLGVSVGQHFGCLLGRNMGDPASSWWYWNGPSAWTQLPTALVQSQWYSIKRIVNFAEDKEWVYIDGVYQGYYAWREYDGEVDSISHVWFALGESETGTMWLNSFRTRQYVSPEPTQGSWGSEENHICTIESCNADGTEMNTYNLDDEVHVTGSGYSPLQSYFIYVVPHGTLTDEQAFPTPITPRTSTTTDASGNILSTTIVWNPTLTPGKYDIAVDVNHDGTYNAGVDAVDNNEISINAGFFVIPEYALGTVLALGACFAGFVFYKKRKRNG